MNIRKVIKLIRSLRDYTHIKGLVILTNKPLLRYLHLRSDIWINDGLMSESTIICCVLFTSILDWKSNDIGRDCKIITMAPISKVKCADSRSLPCPRSCVPASECFYNDDITVLVR